MQDTKTGGLAGKSRRNRVMKRASRRHTEDLLAEYYDADVEDERTRSIPIKRCSAYWERGADDTGRRGVSGVQDGLVVDRPPRGKRRGDREVVWLSSSGAAPKSKLIDESLLTLVKPMPTTPSAKPDRVIRFKPKRAARASAPSALPFPEEWRPPMAYRSRRRPGSFGGFAYGCLLGSAAAAVMLLIIRVVIG